MYMYTHESNKTDFLLNQVEGKNNEMSSFKGLKWKINL